MQDFYLITNWLVSLVLIGLGCAALLKNHSLILNRVFAAFTVTISIWIITAYISNDISNSPQVSVIGNYFVFLFSYLSAYLLLWFSVTLARDERAIRILRRVTIPIFLIGATASTPLVVAGATRQGQVYAVQFGPLVSVYSVALMALLGWAIIVLCRNIKRTNGVQKSHLVILYWSMVIAVPLLLLTEFILPALTGWFGLTNVGILAMAFPVVGLYYSVVKLKLFDLRLVIVRSLAYVIALLLVSGFYGVTSYYITNVLINYASSAVLRDFLNVLLIMIVIIIYPPVRKQFDRLTNRIFYRDAYDPQTLFDDLNRLLVSTWNLERLMSQSSQIIGTQLKAEFCYIGLKGNDKEYRVKGTGQTYFSAEDIQELHQLTPHVHQSVIVTDYLEPTHADLKAILSDNSVAVLVRLIPNTHHKEEGLGYIVLGPKKSGNAYSHQDARVLDTIGNELIVAIQNALHFEEIQQFNVTLQEKVTAATQQLRNTNMRLKALDETKDDFISMASHQLRTPLTSVKGYLSMVLEGDAGKLTPMQQQMLRQAYVSSQRMVYLIADLLNVSRLKTGKFVIMPSQVNLATMIAEEIDQLRDTAAGHKVEIVYESPADFPDTMLDETKLRQVIMNFMDNAVYYTRAGGKVIITLQATSKAIELRVRDNGIGVPKAEQHHLFTKFYRAKNARQVRPDGTGLGLFMAKKVVVAQGGVVIFDSQEGKGSTFGFSFSKQKILIDLHATPVSTAV